MWLPCFGTQEATGMMTDDLDDAVLVYRAHGTDGRTRIGLEYSRRGRLVTTVHADELEAVRHLCTHLTDRRFVCTPRCDEAGSDGTTNQQLSLDDLESFVMLYQGAYDLRRPPERLGRSAEHDKPVGSGQYAFAQPPPQPASTACDDCHGLGWGVGQASIARCQPCAVYPDDATATRAAAQAIGSMFRRLGPGEELVRGHGYEPFIVHPLTARETCPDCANELTSIEAGYDRYGSVTLEDKVLWIEPEAFSDDGGGPHYLYCRPCQRAYALPDAIDFR